MVHRIPRTIFETIIGLTNHEIELNAIITLLERLFSQEGNPFSSAKSSTSLQSSMLLLTDDKTLAKYS